MSNISKLPVYKFLTGAQVDEDWALAFAVSDMSGAPLDLSGITFTAWFSTQTAQIAKLQGLVCGTANQCVLFLALAGDKTVLTPAQYRFSILATDGELSRDLIGRSTFTAGDAQTIQSSLLPTDGPQMAVVTIINPAVVAVADAVSGSYLVTTQSASPLGNVQIANGVGLKSDRSNVGKIYVEIDADATTNSFWLDPGDLQSFAVTNLSKVHVLGAHAGDRLGYIGQ